MKKASEQIFIEGAIHTVAKNGIENTRTKQIADYAGFSEATLFRLFETKDGILEAAFLYVDKKLSEFFTRNDFSLCRTPEQFHVMMKRAWHEMYRCLIANPDESIYLVRYRYSSLYTNAVRSRRKAYQGMFEGANDVFEGFLGNSPQLYRGFLISFVFEMTLCFAEKVIAGRIQDTPETEENLWNTIYAAVKSIV